MSIHMIYWIEDIASWQLTHVLVAETRGATNHLTFLSLQNSWVDSLQWKPFSASTWLQQAEGHGSKKARTQGGLVQKQEQYDITDQIPEIVKPMGVVEGTSYTVLIIAGLAFAGKKPFWCMNIVALGSSSSEAELRVSRCNLISSICSTILWLEFDILIMSSKPSKARWRQFWDSIMENGNHILPFHIHSPPRTCHLVTLWMDPSGITSPMTRVQKVYIKNHNTFLCAKLSTLQQAHKDHSVQWLWSGQRPVSCCFLQKNILASTWHWRSFKRILGWPWG